MTEGSIRGELGSTNSLPDIQRLAEELVASAAARGVQLTGEGGLLTALTRRVRQSALEVEMAEHLGYDRTTRLAVGRTTRATGRSPGLRGNGHQSRR